MDKIGKCGLCTKFDIKDNMDKIRKYGQNWKIWTKLTMSTKLAIPDKIGLPDKRTKLTI